MIIKILHVTDDNGDCELGCWNEASGYLINIDGVDYQDLAPHASCTSSTDFGSIDLLKFVLEKIGRSDIAVEESYENSI